MEWAVPEHSASAVNEAGLVLAAQVGDPEAVNYAVSIINNWRTSHQFPLNTFQTTLRRKVENFPGSLIVQRVKRLRAIQHKLRKHTRNPILLSEMQDIGGCRVVLQSLAQVGKFHDAYVQSDLKHELVCHDDYIAIPKPSGYRGIHLIYKYNSDRKETYNGLQIEVQLRSQLQHAWATAVEIVGFFRGELLKSSEGDPVWKHFFKLMAVEIAFQERAPFGIPGMPEDRDIVRRQLRRCALRLDAMNYLRTIGNGVEELIEVETGGAHYFLLELDTNEKRLKVTGYKFSARDRATMDYATVESMILGSAEREAVLVSAASMADLRRAYYNYFLNMDRFIGVVETAIS